MQRGRQMEPENVEKVVFLHYNLPPVPLPYKRTSNKSDMTEEPSEIDYNYSNDYISDMLLNVMYSFLEFLSLILIAHEY